MVAVLTGRNGVFAGILACALGLSTPPAFAGGLSLSYPNTDILFTEGKFSFQAGTLSVIPHVGYKSLNGRDVPFSKNVNDIVVPEFAVKYRVSDAFSCALHFNRPYGISGNFNTDAQNAQADLIQMAGFPRNASMQLKVESEEYGTTCAVSAPIGPGRAYLIGGGFLESVHYEERYWTGTLNLRDDPEPGWRAGAAYAIPEYAMRFEVLYRSQINHHLTGDMRPTALGVGYGYPNMPIASTGEGTLPQTLSISAQSGIAPGWLVYGSLIWVNWNRLASVDFDLGVLGKTSKFLRLDDGYTAQIGIGHAFNDRLTGAVGLLWDAKTGSSSFILPQSVGATFGLEYKTDYGKFRAGALVAHISGGSQDFLSGATVTAKQDSGWAVVPTLSYSVEF